MHLNNSSNLFIFKVYVLRLLSQSLQHIENGVYSTRLLVVNFTLNTGPKLWVKLLLTGLGSKLKHGYVGRMELDGEV